MPQVLIFLTLEQDEKIKKRMIEKGVKSKSDMLQKIIQEGLDKNGV